MIFFYIPLIYVNTTKSKLNRKLIVYDISNINSLNNNYNMENISGQQDFSQQREFRQRLDFYWQYLTAYFVVLLIYGILRGSVEEGYFTIKWQDPVVILLFMFMLLSATFLLYNYLKKKSIIIGKDFITFQTRDKIRHYQIDDIQRISIGKYSKRNPSAIYRLVKIKVNSRKYAIRFRPNSYVDDEILVEYVLNFKREVDKKRLSSYPNNNPSLN